jgi:hypothetical protein
MSILLAPVYVSGTARKPARRRIRVTFETGMSGPRRNAILAGAAAYSAAGPSLMVHDHVVDAVAPLIDTAAQEQDTAERYLDADKSKEQSTQNQLTAL